MNIPILFGLLRIEPARWLRWIIRAMLALSFPAVVSTYSRGAWLGLVAVTVLIFLKSKHRLLKASVAAILMLILVPILPHVLPHSLLDRYDLLVNYEADESAQIRFKTWDFCQRVGAAHPLTGGGFDFYSPETYAQYLPDFSARWPGRVATCHSVWFSMLGEHGIPGLLLWLTLIGTCFLSIGRIRAYGRSHDDKHWFVDCADMLQIAFLAYILVSTFIDTANFDLFYQLVAAVVILKNLKGRTDTEVSSSIPVTSGGSRVHNSAL